MIRVPDDILRAVSKFKPLGTLLLLAILFSQPLLSEVDEPSGPAIIGTGETTVVFPGGLQGSTPYSKTGFGPLLALAPLVARLGGTLDVGPLAQSHELTLYGKTAIFGPLNRILTLDQNVISLSQPPQMGAMGLHVPVDLLEKTLGDIYGLEFRWDSISEALFITKREPRRLQAKISLVGLPGISTLVLEFPTRPRYRLEDRGTVLDVQLLGDRLAAPPRIPSVGPFLESIDVKEDLISIRLAPEVIANHYELSSPFRLVIDLQHEHRDFTPENSDSLPSNNRGGQWVVVIDPGHGGSETGATGPSGTHEKEITLILARALKRRLESRMAVKVVLTRNEDAGLPLNLRSAIANQNKADLFISIHLNSVRGTSAHGAETYFLATAASDARAQASAERENVDHPETASSTGSNRDLQMILWDLAQTLHLSESQRLAALIQEELNQTLKLRNRGVKQAPFTVLMGAASPAVLVELGFISNPDEEAKLLEPAYRADLVESLVRAIMRFRYASLADGEESAP